MILYLAVCFLTCIFKVSAGHYTQPLKEYSVPRIVSTGACKYPGLYLAGKDLCSYRECSLDPTPNPQGNYGLVAVTRQCAPGTGVPYKYAGGQTNPCVNVDMTCGGKYEYIDLPKMLEPIVGDKYSIMKSYSKESKESVEGMSSEPIESDSKGEMLIPVPTKRMVESVEISGKVILDPSPTPNVIQKYHAKQAGYWKRKSNYSHRSPYYNRHNHHNHHNQPRTLRSQPEQLRTPNHPPKPMQPSRHHQPPRQRQHPGSYEQPKLLGYHGDRFTDYSPRFYEHHHPIDQMFQKGKFYYRQANRSPF